MNLFFYLILCTLPFSAMAETTNPTASSTANEVSTNKSAESAITTENKDAESKEENKNKLYLKMGEASTKKVNLLVKFLPANKTKISADKFINFDKNFQQVLLNDLKVSSLFNLFEEENTAEKIELKLEVTYEFDDNQIKLDSNGKKSDELLAHFTEQTKASISNPRKAAHVIANSYIKSLTGVAGPFNTRIVTTTDRAGGLAREIFIFDWDFANAEQITKHKNLSRTPNWSWDGNLIAYTALVQTAKDSFINPALLIYDIRTKKTKSLANRPGNNSGASFAKDNESIFMTSSSEGSADIYKIATDDGKILAKLTKGPMSAMNIEPMVSPDGTQIAFSSDRVGATALYIMNIDGTGVRRLTHFKEFANAPSWSPDGTKLAFAAQDSGNFDIFTVNVDGSGLKRITAHNRKPNGKKANNEYPTFSSDGRLIMYTSDRTGKNQIYVSTVDGNNEYQITQDENNYYSPKWSWTER